MTARPEIKALPPTATGAALAAAARAGLAGGGQKTLPPMFLYDPLGSALFEAITQLPEYGVWRAERQLLADNAEVIAAGSDASCVIELGSGSATKTVSILRALLERRPQATVSYCTVDLSPGAIERTRSEVGSLPGLRLACIEDEYLPGLEAALRSRPADGRALVLFLGSSLGNFDHPAGLAFLRRLRRTLRAGDGLLLGADLDKAVERLLAAYDDALGVTAAFNLNLLARLNRELGADFRLAQFHHRVRFNEASHDVEMHLESLCDQQVHFPHAGFSVRFRRGETIHTESSHKYSLAELAELAGASGFEPVAQWCDGEWQFASGLYRAA
ncbi:MAG TPA: L-histidine N(alpha)-methyltransferase [Rhodocyclaceae bacterium]|nr:L-histidine N(alpha)-methyltransferase [Rhodocyclaceae bacterium]